MTRPLAVPERLEYAPRLLPADQAARYLGMSTSKLRTLGIPRKVADGKRLYDRFDLDMYAADLPYEQMTDKTDAANGDWG